MIVSHGRRRVKFRIDLCLFPLMSLDEFLATVGRIESELASNVLNKQGGIREKIDQAVSGRRVQSEGSFEESGLDSVKPLQVFHCQVTPDELDTIEGAGGDFDVEKLDRRGQ